MWIWAVFLEAASMQAPFSPTKASFLRILDQKAVKTAFNFHLVPVWIDRIHKMCNNSVG